MSIDAALLERLRADPAPYAALMAERLESSLDHHIAMLERGSQETEREARKSAAAIIPDENRYPALSEKASSFAGESSRSYPGSCQGHDRLE